MGKCLSVLSCGVIKRFNSTSKNIVLLLAGLDNAGKTTAAKGLVGDPVEKVVPTVGFTSIRLIHRGFNVIIYDLGGGPQIRGIWNKYFSDVHGVIFVVDASDASRIGESKNELEKLLCHEKLAEKPFLILANKQDIKGAMDEIDIVESLCLEQLVNQQKCPTLVEICSSVPLDAQKTRVIDPGLLRGYRWLLRHIINDYSKLNARVEKDMKEEQDRINIQRESWRMSRDAEPEIEEHEENHTDFFRPIDEVIKDIGNQPKVIKSNFKTRNDSTDSNQNTKMIVEAVPQTNGHVVETDPGSFAADIRDQLENKGNQQRRKALGRKNRVGPEPRGGCELPPLIIVGQRSTAIEALTSPHATLRSAAVSNLEAASLSRKQAMALSCIQATALPGRPRYLLPPLRRPQELRPFTSRSLGNEVEAWGLHEDLEIVLPKPGSKRDAKSDDEDVITS